MCETNSEMLKDIATGVQLFLINPDISHFQTITMKLLEGVQ